MALFESRKPLRFFPVVPELVTCLGSALEGLPEWEVIAKQ